MHNVLQHALSMLDLIGLHAIYVEPKPNDEGLFLMRKGVIAGIDIREGAVIVYFRGDSFPYNANRVALSKSEARHIMLSSARAFQYKFETIANKIESELS